MKVIPAVNEPTFEKVKEKIFAIRDTLEALNVHIDVTDGKFTPHQTWNDVKDVVDLRFIVNNFNFNLGIHLMVENPDEIIDAWLEAGIHTIVAHFENIKDIKTILEKCEKKKVNFILALNPSTNVEEIGDIGRFKHILLLAVNPGAAGQEFQDVVLEKIKRLREKGFGGKIIVDGGIEPNTTKKVKDAGADVVVSASYIWNNIDPKKGYEELKAI
jgi:ribulose-phosphate 3-epimerase